MGAKISVSLNETSGVSAVDRNFAFELEVLFVDLISSTENFTATRN